MLFDLDTSSMEGLAQRLEYAQRLYLAGADPATIPQQLYCHFLPDTSAYQGKLMADHLKTRISEFDRTRVQLNVYPGEEGKQLLSAQLLQLLVEYPLDQQCQMLYQLWVGMDALELGLQTGTEPQANRTDFYDGFVTVPARNKLLRQVTDKLLDQPAQPEHIPRWLLSDHRIRLKELDMDTYRAVVSMSIYTLLLDGGCEQAFQGRPVSLDFVAAEVCRCSLSNQDQITYESRAELDWSVVKIFLAMGILAGGCTVVILSESLAVACVAYYATVLSVGALILFWNELDTLPPEHHLEVHTEQEDWARASAAARIQSFDQELNKAKRTIILEELNPDILS